MTIIKLASLAATLALAACTSSSPPNINDLSDEDAVEFTMGSIWKNWDDAVREAECGYYWDDPDEVVLSMASVFPVESSPAVLNRIHEFYKDHC